MPQVPQGPPAPRASAAVDTTTADTTVWVWRADPPESRDPSYLLGVVGQQGTPRCTADDNYDAQWVGVYPTIGRVSVGGPEDPVFDSVMDQPVLALGQPRPRPVRTVEPSGDPDGDPGSEPCAPMQMRSDWRQTPRGILVVREPAPSIEHFEVQALRPLHELSARLDADAVMVTLQNPVPVVLEDVSLRVHYEGCFGKPGTTTKTHEIGKLGLGAVASTRVVQQTTEADSPPGRRIFRAASVQLVGRADGVVIDLDVPLRALGATVDCPR